MTYKIVTLGCKVNFYESNVISDMLKSKGYKESNNPDIYIINTCTVTNSADSKTMKAINKILDLNKIIVVLGCLVQIKKDDLNQLDQIDILVGNDNKSKVVEYIETFIKERKKIVDVDKISLKFDELTLNNSHKTRAFVKIQDGCNNYCSFCIIPYARGPARSKDNLKVVSEVSKLVLNGHKEIVLTGIHTGNYGVDLSYSLTSLIKDLIKIKGLERIRISSIEVTEITDEFLKLLKTTNILVDHMHIPLQSGSNEILKLMNRKYTKEQFISIINKIREIRPNISITTDVIVGFPSETDELFNETIDTIKKINFSSLHVFPYSKKENTKASLMKNQVSDVVKKSRVKELLVVSKELNYSYMSKFIGKEVYIIVESYKDGYVKGHTGNYLMVKVEGQEDLVHKTIKVKIINVLNSICIGTKI